LICLARKTDWLEMGSEQYFGLGQRMFASDVADYPLMELRDVKLDSDDGVTGRGE
jgi:type VI secretion system protein ImpE